MEAEPFDLEKEEPSEVTPLSSGEAEEVTSEASRLLDDVEETGLRLCKYGENDELFEPMIPQVRAVATMAYMMNSEFVAICYDRHGIVVEKSRHSDMPISAPSDRDEALAVADVMVDALRQVEPLFDQAFHTDPLDKTYETELARDHRSEVSKQLFTAMKYAFVIRGALVVAQSGFDFNAMNSALGVEKPEGGSSRFL